MYGRGTGLQYNSFQVEYCSDGTEVELERELKLVASRVRWSNSHAFTIVNDTGYVGDVPALTKNALKSGITTLKERPQ